MNPDVNSAKEYFNSPEGHQDLFGPYSSAYIITNENLRHSMSFMPETKENVLTVAASGDHPMFAKLYGAKNVDCFDISYNSKCIMDIKTRALQQLTYDEYCVLLDDLWHCKDVPEIPNMAKIIDKLPDEEREYLLQMRGFKLFNHGVGISQRYMIKNSEYENMRDAVKEPFNFIWSDLASLNTNKHYDFIHLSNVFDYFKNLNTYTYIDTLAKIMQRVNPGGVVYFEIQELAAQYFQDNIDVLRQQLKSKWTGAAGDISGYKYITLKHER